MHRILIFIIACVAISCVDEWEQPVVFTVNLSLNNPPDSVDTLSNTYYYSDGMILQLRLNVTSNENALFDGVKGDRTNFHFEDEEENAVITGKVVKLSSDTNSLSRYPVYMVVRKDLELIFEQSGVENSFTL